MTTYHMMLQHILDHDFNGKSCLCDDGSERVLAIGQHERGD